MVPIPSHKKAIFQCPYCPTKCKSSGGLTQHHNAKHVRHPDLGKDVADIYRRTHAVLDGMLRYNFPSILLKFYLATPCNIDGDELPQDEPPPTPTAKSSTDWSPFESRQQFELAEFLFAKTEMPASKIDELMDIWAATSVHDDRPPPFNDHNDMQKKIDEISLGHVPWQSLTAQYTGHVPLQGAPTWMKKKYEIWFRDPRKIVHNILANPDFNGEFDYTPYQEFRDGVRTWGNFMSGNWAWKQAVCLVSLRFRSDLLAIS